MRRSQILLAFTLVGVISGFAQSSLDSCDSFALFAEDYSKYLSPRQYPSLHRTNRFFEATLSSGAPLFYRNSFFTNDTITRRILWNPIDLPTLALQILSTSVVGNVIVVQTNTMVDGIKRGGGADIPESWLFGAKQFWVYLGGSVLAAFAIPATVYYTGKWMGGNGEITWTVVGAYSTAAVAVLLFALPGRSSGAHIFSQIIFAGVVGGIVGYQLSSSTVYEDNQSASLRWFPPVKSEDVENFRLVVFSIRL